MTDVNAWYAPHAHPAEAIFAKVLKAADIVFEYEPVSIPVHWDENGEPDQWFTPDFYLPDVRTRRPGWKFWKRHRGRFVEITTCRRAHVTRKHKKLRLARELNPQFEFRILYRQDIYRACEEIGMDYKMALLPDQVERYADELEELRTKEETV